MRNPLFRRTCPKRALATFHTTICTGKTQAVAPKKTRIAFHATLGRNEFTTVSLFKTTAIHTSKLVACGPTPLKFPRLLTEAGPVGMNASWSRLPPAPRSPRYTTHARGGPGIGVQGTLGLHRVDQIKTDRTWVFLYRGLIEAFPLDHVPNYPLVFLRRLSIFRLSGLFSLAPSDSSAWFWAVGVAARGCFARRISSRLAAGCLSVHHAHDTVHECIRSTPHDVRKDNKFRHHGSSLLGIRSRLGESQAERFASISHMRKASSTRPWMGTLVALSTQWTTVGKSTGAFYAAARAKRKESCQKVALLCT